MQRDTKFLGLRLRTDALAAVIIIALAGVASMALSACDQKQPPKQDAATTQATPETVAAAQPKVHLEKLQWLDTPRAAPDTPFVDAAGMSHTLSEFSGKVLVVNFWATWCAPCVQEMPTLDKLQTDIGGDKLAVLAISQDREGAKVAQPFAADHGWKSVALYFEPAGHFARDATLRGLPTSLLIDRQGREVARLEGENAWDAPEVEKVVRDLISRP